MAGMAASKVIIDTDPGCDDVLAMLFALQAVPEELQVLMISVTYGNVDVKSCLRNVVTMFHHIDKELEWRRNAELPLGFDTLRQHKPLVAAGADRPLAEQMLMADFFHGRDGLGDISVSHPHLTPKETWGDILREASQSRRPSALGIVEEMSRDDRLFIPSEDSAHEEILRLLRENEPGTISIVAIGPLTNLAIAAATDPVTFLRVKEVVVMGGAIHAPGNITPLAEFNTFADSIAAARVYALTSPDPRTTMPPVPNFKAQGKAGAFLPPYPDSLPERLKVVLFPLDITERHLLLKDDFDAALDTLIMQGSPLAIWVSAWMQSTFRKIQSLHPDISDAELGLQLHDPMTVWYCIKRSESGWRLSHDEDIRVETTGQWTRGACVTDGRSRKKQQDEDTAEQPGDHGDWLRGGAGNRLSRCLESPNENGFGKDVMLKSIFSLT